MAQYEDAFAVGIGPQSAKGVVNTDVEGATDLITGPASGSGATGILLRDIEDIAVSMARIEQDLGVVTGSRTRVPGAFIRTDATISFDLDMKGNGGTTGTPDAGDYDALEYMIQLFQGTRILEDTPTATETAYKFGVPSTAQEFKTLKIWRGNVSPGSDEAWVIEDCTFNLSLAYEAGVKCVLSVEVVSGFVRHQDATTFPTSPDFGTQTDAAPILKLASPTINGVSRGFKTATLGITYPVIDVLDARTTNGVNKEIGTPVEVSFTADWIAETTQDDFEDILVSDGGVPVIFTLGVPATGASETINAWRFTLPLFQGEVNDNPTTENNKVLRTITGTARHTTANAELLIEAV